MTRLPQYTPSYRRRMALPYNPLGFGPHKIEVKKGYRLLTCAEVKRLEGFYIGSEKIERWSVYLHGWFGSTKWVHYKTRRGDGTCYRTTASLKQVARWKGTSRNDD